MELAPHQSREDHHVGTKLVAYQMENRRDLRAPREGVNLPAPPGLEEQPELHVAVRIGLTGGERAVHQRGVEPVVGRADLANPGDQSFLDQHRATNPGHRQGPARVHVVEPTPPAARGSLRRH